MDPETQRIRSYLQAQAAKLTPQELVIKLHNDSLQLRAAALAFPEARFAEAPAEGEWSANEVMQHVVSTSDAFGLAIEDTLRSAEVNPGLDDRLSHDVTSRSAEEWWALHETNRERLFSVVLSAPTDANLDQTINHPMFGDLNWRETLLFLRVHDLDHARQITAISESLP